MNARHILVVTPRYDIQADFVILRLREKGHLPVRISFEDLPDETALSFRPDLDHPSGTLRTRNRDVNLSTVESVYWRAPIVPETDDRGFAGRELSHAWNTLWDLLQPGCFWMNAPARVRHSVSPAVCLRVAAAAGFELPRTLITSNPDDALAFCDDCGGRAVFKPLSGPVESTRILADGSVQPARIVAPALVDRATLDQNRESVATAPCQLQEYIEKTAELRLTVVDDAVFAAEIRSDRPIRRTVDWDAADALTAAPGNVSETVRTGAIAFARRLGLAYTVIKLAVTPNGRVVFLGHNPNGQCHLTERRIPEHAMITAIADRLIRGTATT